MDLLAVLLVTAVFPVACLAFVLWMGRIEDAIPASVARAVRRPDPAPVLRIPVRRPSAAPVLIPAQRTGAVEAVVPPAPAPAPVPAQAATPAGT
jgi:hypothetical protein